MKSTIPYLSTVQCLTTVDNFRFHYKYPIHQGFPILCPKTDWLIDKQNKCLSWHIYLLFKNKYVLKTHTIFIELN